MTDNDCLVFETLNTCMQAAEPGRNEITYFTDSKMLLIERCGDFMDSSEITQVTKL